MTASTTAWVRKRGGFIAALVNVLQVAAFVIGVVALLALVWLYVRPIPTANIKVPVATDQASYYPGQDVSGIFFGDTYFNGEVRILREVYCKNYKGFIKPPAYAAVGNFFSTQAKPRHLEGETINVGNLPDNIPVGVNCVLQFTNVYEVQTPFGIRHIEYQYYTQNFSIITKARRMQLDCEASGRTDCNFINDTNTNSPDAQPTATAPQSSPETAQPSSTSSTQQRSTTTTNNNTTNNTTTNNTTTTAEPAPQFHEECTINALGIKIGCRQVPNS